MAHDSVDTRSTTEINQIVAAALKSPALSQLGVTLLDESDVAHGITAQVNEVAVNIFDNLHAGAAAGLLEFTAYLAVLPTLGSTEQAVTHAFSASYIRAARLGQVVSSRAVLTSRSGRLAFLSATLSRGDDVLATAIVTKSIVRVAP